MPTMQEEMSGKVLDPQRETNNALMYKPIRGVNTPTSIRKIKVNEYKRLMNEGVAYNRAAVRVGAASTTLAHWAHEMGSPLPRLGSKPKGKRRHTGRPKTFVAKPFEPKFTISQFVRAAGFPMTETDQLKLTVKLLLEEAAPHAQ